jgi:hypothetical protein
MGHFYDYRARKPSNTVFPVLNNQNQIEQKKQAELRRSSVAIRSVIRIAI